MIAFHLRQAGALALTLLGLTGAAQAQGVIYYGSPYRVYYGSPYSTYYPGVWPGYYASYYPGYVYPPAPVVRSFYADPVPGQQANLTVRVPESAELWLQGVPMTQQGEQRTFRIPPLQPGRDYIYDVRARWRTNGQEFDWTRRVRVRAGGSYSVDFLNGSEAVSRDD